MFKIDVVDNSNLSSKGSIIFQQRGENGININIMFELAVEIVSKAELCCCLLQNSFTIMYYIKTSLYSSRL